MLEAALKNPKTTPAELAEALLSYIQHDLPGGGSSAEGRFFDFYKDICDRVFGQILLGKDEKDRYHHREGGWLGEQTRWSRSSSQRRPSSSSSSALPAPGTHSSSGNARPSLETDPVVKLLGIASGNSNSFESPPPTLIETIASESSNRPEWGFTLPFDALPKTIREAWLATFGTTPSCQTTENTTKLLTKILRRGPQEQKDLLTLLQRRDQSKQHFSMVQLSPRGFHGTIGSPGFHSPSPVKSKNGDSSPDQDSPNVILGMLEYFLFLFFRFPKAKPVIKYNPVPPGMYSPSSYQREKTEPYGDTIYHFLFRKYLLYFLPYENEGNRQIGSSADKRQSELFVRILIAMWLEAQGRVKTTSDVVNAILRRSGGAGPMEFGLNLSYDLIQIQFDAPAKQIRQCLRSTVVHMILDPDLSRRALKDSSWALKETLTTFQQPFYNHVRASFRHGSIHQSESPFYAALDAWLIWLEPWNVTDPASRDFSPRHATQRIMGTATNSRAHRKRTLFYPRHNHKSRYTSVWEPYIAANVHLYATPLAIFLRRAREMDFTAKNVQRSMTILRRVFRVFTPEVVDAISRHLSGSSDLPHLVQSHTLTLGPFAPPPGPQTLTSCQGDMKAMLEEIQFQHMKKIRDLDVVEKWVAYVESFFQSGVVSGEEREMHRLLESARVIVQLPSDYMPQTGSQDVAVKSTPAEARELIKNGTLTEEGHRNVVMGATKISPFSVDFVGDKAKARAGTFELEILVDLAVWISEVVKVKSGLDINFRVFADYRNFLACSMLTYVLWFFVKKSLAF